MPLQKFEVMYQKNQKSVGFQCSAQKHSETFGLIEMSFAFQNTSDRNFRRQSHGRAEVLPCEWWSEGRVCAVVAGIRGAMVGQRAMKDCGLRGWACWAKSGIQCCHFNWLKFIAPSWCREQKPLPHCCLKP